MNAPNPTPIRNASDKAIALLRMRILTGVLASGEIIRDADIATELGCSRTPVREALKTLEQLGAIESVRGRLTRVATIDLDDLHQLETPIIALTRLLIPDTVDKLDDTDVDKLEDINTHLRQRAADNDWPAALEANWNFHQLLADRATNRYVATSLTNLMFHSERIGAIRYYAAPDNVTELANEHDHIIAALRHRDSNAAVDLLVHHARVTRSSST